MPAIAALVFGSAIGAAQAANAPDPRLDVVATSVAGHPVTVYCETDPAVWASGPGPGVGAYTWPPHMNPQIEQSQWNVIFVGPPACGSLHRLLDHTGTLVDNAGAIHLLVHESFHQRDGVYGNYQAGDAYPNSFEGRTDCAALAADEGVAINFFGYPAIVDQTSNELTEVKTSTIVYRYVRRKVHGHWRRVRVKRRVTETTYVLTPVVTKVRNPDLDKMHSYQQAYHNSNAKNPAYAGDCTT
jgi:hypothetical protein